MTNEQRQKIAEHLRAIGDVLTEVGHGDYAIDLHASGITTMGGPRRTTYTLKLIALTREEIQ